MTKRVVPPGYRLVNLVLYFEHSTCAALAAPGAAAEFGTAVSGVVGGAAKGRCPSCSVWSVLSACGSIVATVSVLVPEDNAAGAKDVLRAELQQLIRVGRARFVLRGVPHIVSHVFPVTKTIRLGYTNDLSVIAPSSADQQQLLGRLGNVYGDALGAGVIVAWHGMA